MFLKLGETVRSDGDGAARQVVVVVVFNADQSFFKAKTGNFVITGLCDRLK